MLALSMEKTWNVNRAFIHSCRLGHQSETTKSALVVVGNAIYVPITGGGVIPKVIPLSELTKE